MTDRARPGLVAFYDIRPGNGVGQFLQPRSQHGAFDCNIRSTSSQSVSGDNNKKMWQNVLSWEMKTIYEELF